MFKAFDPLLLWGVSASPSLPSLRLFQIKDDETHLWFKDYLGKIGTLRIML